MSVAGMMTPLRSAAYNNLQLNAGLFLVGAQALDTTNAHSFREDVNDLLDEYVYNNESTASESSGGKIISTFDSNCILGATRGGGSFVVNTETRQAEADGVRYRFVGDTFVDSVDAQLTATVIEMFPGNIKRILGSADITHTTNSHKWRISQRTRINKVTDYIRYLWWIGDLADGRLVAIKFKYAINTAGLSMSFTDKGEATIPVEFHAVQASVEDYDKAPFEIYFLDDDITDLELVFDESAITVDFSRDTLFYTFTLGEVSGEKTLQIFPSDGVNIAYDFVQDGDVLKPDSTCLVGQYLSMYVLASGQSEGSDGVTGLALPFTVRLKTKNPNKVYQLEFVEEAEDEEEDA